MRCGCRALLNLVVAATCGIGLALAAGGIAHAQSTSGSSVKDASRHFQRGVVLYNEADYRAALVEFRRAYEIAPNAAVLYNIGQTYYQLQNYASALLTLERYLLEAGATASHRREVEQTVEILQARVGKVAITTNVPDCEITIDDELVGRTPLAEPVLVSIGRRKITAMREGRPAETRFVDVAAGDTVKLSLAFADAGTGAAGTADAPPPSDRRGLIRIGWIATGVLGAATITTGALAFSASRDLGSERDTIPGRPDELERKSSRVRTLSLVADVLGVATLITGGITLKLTLSRSRDTEVSVGVVPGGIQVAGRFR